MTHDDLRGCWSPGRLLLDVVEDCAGDGSDVADSVVGGFRYRRTADVCVVPTEGACRNGRRPADCAVGESLPDQPFQQFGQRVEVDDVEVLIGTGGPAAQSRSGHIGLIGGYPVGDLAHRPVTGRRVVRTVSGAGSQLRQLQILVPELARGSRYRFIAPKDASTPMPRYGR